MHKQEQGRGMDKANTTRELVNVSWGEEDLLQVEENSPKV